MYTYNQTHEQGNFTLFHIHSCQTNCIHPSSLTHTHTCRHTPALTNSNAQPHEVFTLRRVKSCILLLSVLPSHFTNHHTQSRPLYTQWPGKKIEIRRNPVQRPCRECESWQCCLSAVYTAHQFLRPCLRIRLIPSLLYIYYTLTVHASI